MKTIENLQIKNEIKNEDNNISKHILKDINEFDFNLSVLDENKNIFDLTENFFEKNKKNKKIFNLIKDETINETYANEIINSFINNMYWFETAYNFIIEKIKANESFLIYWDYDSDGINSTINTYLTLNILKFLYKSNSDIKIKNWNRLEWYWIKPTVIKENKDFFTKYDNIITVDLWCSIDFSLIKNEVNIIVFDHHLPTIEQMSDWILYINPIFYSETHLIKDLISKDTKYITNNVNKYYDNDWKKRLRKVYKEDILNKLNKDNIKNMTEIWNKISAWLLTAFFWRFVMDKLIKDDSITKTEKIKNNLEKIKDFYLITWTITTITDVMPLQDIINFTVVQKWSQIYNNLLNEADEKTYINKYDFIFGDKEKITDVSSYIIWNIVNNYIYVLKQFEDKEWNKRKFSITNIWFYFWPYFNSFWRTIIPEYLIYKIIQWQKDDSYNTIRKNNQKLFEEKILENIKEYSANKVNIVDIQDLIKDWSKTNLFNNNSYEELMYTLMNFFNEKLPYFDNFYSEDKYNINKDLKKKLTLWLKKDIKELIEQPIDVIIKNKVQALDIVSYIEENKIMFTEWIVWLIANKVNTGYIWIAWIWEKSFYWNNILIKSSWRSKIDFNDIQEELKKKKIIAYFWWHNRAFWIGVFKDKIKDFQNYIEEKWIMPNINIDIVYDVNYYKNKYKDLNNYNKTIQQYTENLMYLNNKWLLNVYNTYLYWKVNKQSIRVMWKNNEHIKFSINGILNNEIILFYHSNINKLKDKLETCNNVLLQVKEFKPNTFYSNRESISIITDNNMIFFN